MLSGLGQSTDIQFNKSLLDSLLLPLNGCLLLGRALFFSLHWCYASSLNFWTSNRFFWFRIKLESMSSLGSRLRVLRIFFAKIGVNFLLPSSRQSEQGDLSSSLQLLSLSLLWSTYGFGTFRVILINSCLIQTGDKRSHSQGELKLLALLRRC